MEKILAEYEQKMKKSLEVMHDSFSSVRTGRSSPALVEKLAVDYYGSSLPLQQLATISVPDPRSLMVHPFDKNALPEIEKAIVSSNLGITPQNDGQNIRLTFPTLSEERRQDLVKMVKGMAEESKVAVRNIRREALDHFKSQEKEKQISEDRFHILSEEIQELTDKYTKEIEQELHKKEAEILEV